MSLWIVPFDLPGFRQGNFLFPKAEGYIFLPMTVKLDLLCRQVSPVRRVYARTCSEQMDRLTDCTKKVYGTRGTA